MAYQVTKRIRGRDYGYLVDCYRDPITGSRRSRWRTIRSRKRVGRNKIIDATARLLEHRDPRNLTVGVIVKEACASHSTFYRYFPDRTSAIRAALEQICDRLSSALPSLDGPLKNQTEARNKLRDWCEACCGLALRERAVRWALSQQWHVPIDATIVLTMFLKRLNEAALAMISDPEQLAREIKELLMIEAAEYSRIVAIIQRAVFGAPCSDTSSFR